MWLRRVVKHNRFLGRAVGHSRMVVAALAMALIASSAAAIDFRWTFDMGGGTMEVYIKNSSGSVLSISCRSGGEKDLPKISLDSNLTSKTSDEDVQFIVDKKNFPITFTKGYFDGAGRLAENAVWNFLSALKDTHSAFFVAEYPSKAKSERFSTLDVRDNVDEIIRSCY